MGETLLFTIPTPDQNQNPVYSLEWYQSVDASSWGDTPVDSIDVSNLQIDPDTGKYIWASSDVDPYKYHNIVSVDVFGTKDINNGMIISPKENVVNESSVYGIKVETFSYNDYNNRALYEIGDTVSLALQIDYSNIVHVGNTINVEIRDIFENLIATVQATRVNDIYVAEWTVPLLIHKLYNISQKTDISPDNRYYYLTDRWLFPDGALNFDFLVQRAIENPVQDNCEYIVTIDSVLSENNEISDAIAFKFSSFLTPYYSSIDDVKAVMVEELSQLDDFDLAKDIRMMSKQVDLHMKPDTIYRQEQYDFAVRMYVKYSVARNHLEFLLNINAESKELDMLKYSKNSGNPERALDNIDSLIAKYAWIILAGGKDTPFVPKTFTKGIFDPNRPSASRATLDISDPYPWVNTTTSSSVINVNGNAVELRGTRTVSFLKNRSSFPNIYLRSEGVS